MHRGSIQGTVNDRAHERKADHAKEEVPPTQDTGAAFRFPRDRVVEEPFRPPGRIFQSLPVTTAACRIRQGTQSGHRYTAGCIARALSRSIALPRCSSQCSVIRRLPSGVHLNHREIRCDGWVCSNASASLCAGFSVDLSRQPPPSPVRRQANWSRVRTFQR